MHANSIAKARRKRTLIAAALILIAVPSAITLLNFQNYILVSLIVLALTTLPFFIAFEKGKTKTQEIVLIAVMCAITVCAHLLFGATMKIRAGTAIIIVCGIALGPEAGFMIGTMGRFVYNFYAGHGPWSPWQMFCWGLLGFLAGISFNCTDTEKSKNSGALMGSVMCLIFAIVVAYLSYVLFPPVDGTTFFGWRLYLFGAVGLLAGVIVYRKRLPTNNITITLFTFFITFILYGGLMNIFNVLSMASMPENPGISLEVLKMYYISGVPYDLVHATTAAIFNFVFGEKLLQKFERIKLKYGINR